MDPMQPNKNNKRISYSSDNNLSGIKKFKRESTNTGTEHLKLSESANDRLKKLQNALKNPNPDQMESQMESQMGWKPPALSASQVDKCKPPVTVAKRPYINAVRKLSHSYPSQDETSKNYKARNTSTNTPIYKQSLIGDRLKLHKFTSPYSLELNQKQPLKNNSSSSNLNSTVVGLNHYQPPIHTTFQSYKVNSKSVSPNASSNFITSPQSCFKDALNSDYQSPFQNAPSNNRNIDLSSNSGPRLPEFRRKCLANSPATDVFKFKEYNSKSNDTNVSKNSSAIKKSNANQINLDAVGRSERSLVNDRLNIPKSEIFRNSCSTKGPNVSETQAKSSENVSILDAPALNRDFFSFHLSTRVGNVSKFNTSNLNKSISCGHSENRVLSNMNDNNKSINSVPQNIFNTTRSNVEPEPMEWTDVDVVEVIENVEQMRKVQRFKPETLTDLQRMLNANNDFAEKYQNPRDDFNERDYFIVVDTNVFLSTLGIIKQILSINIKDNKKLYVYIPWMVIQELDYFKDNRCGTNKLQANARKAILLLNECLGAQGSRVKAQLVSDALEAKTISKEPDDVILACCLQAKERNHIVILLSNDTNLRNKAIINKISAYSTNDILEKLKFNTDNSAFQFDIEQIELRTSILLSVVIDESLRNAYGNIIDQMNVKKPPYTLLYALELMRKYWITVFSSLLQKQCLNTIDKLYDLVKQKAYTGLPETEDRSKMVDLILSLCMFLKISFSKHTDNINILVKYIQSSTAH